MDEVTIKRNILLSQLSFLGLIVSLIHVVIDYFEGFPVISLIDFGMASVFFIVYALNKKGHHQAAKFLFLIFLNVSLFAIANVVPRDMGIYLLFFPIFGITFMLFEYEQRKERFGFLLLSMIMVLVLELGDYQIFGSINLQDTEPKLTFVVNLLTACIVLMFSINFLIKINHRTEGVLQKSKEEQKDLLQQIKEKNIVLEKANHELDRFVYSTSHDLRAPLRSVLGLINLTKLETNDNTVQEYMQMMEKRINNLDQFIQEIIDYSRNSRSEIKIEKVDMKALVSEVIDNYQFLDGFERIDFKKEVLLTEPIELDKNRLKIVLNNLIANAIKYHDYKLSDPFVKVRIGRSNGHVEIAVKDNGPGINETEQPKIFDMFYRGTETSTGSGLGLYIVKEMISKMNGQIELKSVPRKGSEFLINLPYESMK
ncbi:HAMP domain-containing sensor histidine kinase [Fulvivirgaceae bacterium BMA10]|uniref:histidine kinase n=1 Tax=Splendidivirga corallicola TaxID=3051826 RepID=A0ABT8KPD2_9BACT|nr:HAMP domain-containing sensor histidine kinase [Fulvivirgaceae bacterium BMA10]